MMIDTAVLFLFPRMPTFSLTADECCAKIVSQNIDYVSWQCHLAWHRCVIVNTLVMLTRSIALDLDLFIVIFTLFYKLKCA